MIKKKLFVITGSRSEFGIMKYIISSLKNFPFLTKLIVTGSHFEDSFGKTFKEIEKSKIKIFKKIFIPMKTRSEIDISNYISVSIRKFSSFFKNNKPDYILVVGDRFEIFSVAIAALLHNIRIIHVHGGELSQGSYDDNFRHAITKFSHFHFCTTAVYKKRIIQLGEKPETIFNFGSPSLGNLDLVKLPKYKNILLEYNIPLNNNYFLCTYHPETKLSKTKNIQNLKNFLKALKNFKSFNIIITSPSADTASSQFHKIILKFVKGNINFFYTKSFGNEKYLALLKNAKVVIGNSSSGVIETSYFKTPTINIGSRQFGRLIPKNVINCDYSKENILKSIKYAMSLRFKNSIKKMKSPFYKKKSIENISNQISKILKSKNVNLTKVFNDIK